MLDDEQWHQLAETFIAESQELIQRAEASIAELEEDLTSVEALNSLFRAVHTVKGSAGLLGADFVVDFTHQYESLLVALRDGDLLLDESLLRLCYRCLDRIHDLIEAVASGEQSDPLPEQTQALIVQLTESWERSSNVPVSVRQTEDGGVEPLSGSHENRDQAWHLSLRFDRELFRNGFDPASFLRFLAGHGQLIDVICVLDDLPSTLEDFDPEQCYCGFEITLLSDRGKEEIEQVFEFIEELATIRILPPRSRLEDYIELIQTLPEDDQRLGEILIGAGLLTERELAEGLGLQQAAQGRKLGEIMVDEQMVAPEAVQSALEKQKVVRERIGQTASLKISAAKMDTLINQVGELVIAAEGARLVAQQRGDESFVERAEEVCRHVEVIRESALRLRMVEIGETFKRFHRLVRDTSEELGKSVQLDISGGDTELDKAMVERIYEPLVHLVRNAIDHGLENAEERSLAGKPKQGSVGLNAFHESGMVVIEVTDDGRGIDPDRVLEKAVAQELVTADAELSEQAVLRLIFEPGFSTAASVTNISGRGVGMDSVRKDIEGLRGTVEIENRPGRGCCFRIRLPLTLAIIDGFLVSVGDQYYVIPLDMVTECIDAPDQPDLAGDSGVVDLREKALPFLSLREFFGVRMQAVERQSMVVVRQGPVTAGLLVDRLHGEIQTVIKPLGVLFEHLEGLGGATILGSGDVALILDIGSLLRRLEVRNEMLRGAPGQRPILH